MKKSELIEKVSHLPDNADVLMVINGRVSTINFIDEGQNIQTMETHTIFLSDKEITDGYFQTFKNA